MFDCTKEPRLDEALTDPIILRVMNADHVDPHALEESLRATARKLGQPYLVHRAQPSREQAGPEQAGRDKPNCEKKVPGWRV